MKNFLSHFHVAGIIGLATTVVGILGDASVVGYLPHKVAAGVALAGALIQAGTRAVNKGAVVEVQKDAIATLAPATRASLGVKAQN